MRLVMQRKLSVVCLLLGMASGLAQARDAVLTAIPSDAIGFAVVHNLADASRSIDEVAKLVQATAPDVLNMAKGMTNLQKGLDEQGDLAIVLTSIDPAPKTVMLVPVANFADFFAALQVTDPATGIVEVQLVGQPMLVGRRGDFAAVVPAADREALEKFLNSTTNLASDASLAAWLDANKASVVVTSSGIKQLFPKLMGGIRAAQAQLRQSGGEQAQPAADALNMYVELFTAAEPEIDQYGFGLRIDAVQTIDLVHRLQFTPGGAAARWAATTKPATEDLLAGLPAGPFVMAGGGIVPQRAMERLMKLSVEMMRSQPQFNFTPEQAEKYVALSIESMRGVQSMAMLMGIAEPGTGIYGNTTAVMVVDDSKRFLESYEKSLAAMRELSQEAKSAAIPLATTQRVMMGQTEVVEVTMEFTNMTQLAAPGGPDPKQMMRLMAGEGDKLKAYIAPADEHAVVMAYTSLDRLKAAIDFYKSKQPGLSRDASLAKVAAALPAGSQVVGYVSLGGIAKVAQQFAELFTGGQAAAIPEFPDSPPLGFAVKVSPTGAEQHTIVTAETLRTIGDVVTKARGAAAGVSVPQR